MAQKFEEFLHKNKLFLMLRKTTIRYITVKAPGMEEMHDDIEWVSDVQTRNNWEIRVVQKDGRSEFMRHLLGLRNTNRNEARSRAVIALRGATIYWTPGIINGRVAPQMSVVFPDDLE